MSFIGLGITTPCSYCSTYCNYPASSKTWSMIDQREVRLRASVNNIMVKEECDCCGSHNLKWKDEKIKCNYCGELV